MPQLQAPQHKATSKQLSALLSNPSDTRMMLMKYVCALAAFATTAFAQGIVIAFPTAGTDVKAGEPFIVDVARPVRPFSYPINPFD